MEEINLTVQINRWIAGDLSSENDLISLIYPMLKNAAVHQLRKVSNSSMTPTLLVNELYLKFRKNNSIQLKDKNHFLALSARIIRQILLDDIRSNEAIKRGGSFDLVTLYEDEINGESSKDDPFKLIDWKLLNDSLNELEVLDVESVRLIELKFFAGLNNQEIANVLEVSVSTVSRNWSFAKSWLLNKLNKDEA